jgi:hypothetical protein
MRTLASNPAERADPTARRLTLQRKCAWESTGESCSRCASKPPLQRKSNGSSDGIDIPPVVDSVLASPGTAMDPRTRSTMESRFEHDFSDVRLHSDSQANASAREVGAVAYASGRHVVFGEGAFRPDERRGGALLAHELVHVVQQSRGGAATMDAGSNASLEAEADSAATRFAQDASPISVRGRAGIGLSRATRMPGDAAAVDDEGDEEHAASEADEEDEDDLSQVPGEIQVEDESERTFIGFGKDDIKPAAKPAVKPSDVKPAKPAAPKQPGDAAKKPPPPAVTGAGGKPGSPFLSPEAGFDILISMRGSEVSLPATYIERANKHIAQLKTKKGRQANQQRLGELKRERDRFNRQIKKALAAGAKPNSKEVVALTRERDRAVAERRFRLQTSDVLTNKLKHAPGGGGATTHTSKTYAVIELADAQGNLLARIPASNRKLQPKTDPADVKERIAAAKLKKPGADPGVHAEEAITIAIDRYIKDLHARDPEAAARFKERLKGGSMHVTVDQEVCGGVCQPRIRKVATGLGLHEVTATTVHAVKPDKHAKADVGAGDLESAKKTAATVTDREQVAKLKLKPDQMAARTESIFSHDEAAQGKVTVRRLKPTAAPTLDVSDAHPVSKPIPKAKPTSAAASPHDEGKAPTVPAANGPTAKPGPLHPPPGPKTPSALTNKLNQADMALSAVRDYQRYKQEYLDKGESKESAEAKAVARAGLTLGANLKGGTLGKLVTAANAFDAASKSGQAKDEALATTIGTVGGGMIASKVTPTSAAGAAVQLINTGAQVLGAPQEVQDTTYVAAELVPSSIVGTTITAGARSWHALGKAATGDMKSIDRLGKDMEKGGLGPWLQGYAQWTGIAADVASGDSFGKALDKAAKTGKDSWADRTGSKLADKAFDLGQNKEAIAGKYGPAVGGLAIGLNMAAGLARGESFSEAFAKTTKDAKVGQAALKAKSQVEIDAIRKKASAAAATVRKEAAAVVTKATEVISSTAGNIKASVAPKVAEIKHDVEVAVDKMTTGAGELAQKAAVVVDREIDAGRKFVSSKAADAKNLAKSGWRKLWGD